MSRHPSGIDFDLNAIVDDIITDTEEALKLRIQADRADERRAKSQRKLTDYIRQNYTVKEPEPKP